jgi:hypothetical protein
VTYTDRIEEIGAAPSIGTVGDSFDNAMAESMFSIFKTELFRNPAVLRDAGGHWKGLDDLEIATCRWVSWFNEERLHSELGDATPAEIEADYAAREADKLLVGTIARVSIRPSPIHTPYGECATESFAVADIRSTPVRTSTGSRTAPPLLPLPT